MMWSSGLCSWLLLHDSVMLLVQCILQDLQKQKEAKEEELLGLQKDVNDKKSKVSRYTFIPHVLLHPSVAFHYDRC